MELNGLRISWATPAASLPTEARRWLLVTSLRSARTSVKSLNNRTLPRKTSSSSLRLLAAISRGTIFPSTVVHSISFSMTSLWLLE